MYRAAPSANQPAEPGSPTSEVGASAGSLLRTSSKTGGCSAAHWLPGNHSATGARSAAPVMAVTRIRQLQQALRQMPLRAAIARGMLERVPVFHEADLTRPDSLETSR
jgi:hypothetical protein